MIIEFMRVSNWRSFYGINELWFSTDKTKNVTLIRAENGVGKTSLLAALNWCLFGILPGPDEFENPQNILNLHAIKNDNEKHAKVELEFLHGDKKYKASRTYEEDINKTNALKLVEIKDGADIPLPQNSKPDRFINSVIPREMAPHFFFYGEAKSKYTGTSGSKEFGNAVKSILGSTIANMALKDLETVHKEYIKQATDNTGPEAIKIHNRIQFLEDEILKKKSALNDFAEEAKQAQEHIDEFNKRLAGTEIIKTDQAKRQRLETSLERKKTSLNTAETLKSKWLSEFGVSLLSTEFTKKVNNLLDQKDTRRKIPGNYSKKLVNEVLEDDTCICGRSIGEGTKEREQIKSLLEDATDEMVVNRVMSTKAALERLDERSMGAWQKMKDSEERIIELNGSITDINVDLGIISERLGAHDSQSIKDNENARKRAISQRDIANKKQISLSSEISSYESNISILRKDEKALHSKSEGAKRFVRKVELTTDLINRLTSKLNREETYARVMIRDKLNEIIKEFMRKSFKVEIDKDYKLTVFDENDNKAAKSTGENQLLGLAFTGAIAHFAKDRQFEDDDILLPGTEAPLVVDSPFGHLDTIYKGGVAEFLPKLARQIVLLVSTSQASKEVMNELEGKIGYQYILVSHNKDTGDNKKLEEITINNKVHELTKYNQDFSGTKLVEVG
jgi:DNA sulfur modification protein DndD